MGQTKDAPDEGTFMGGTIAKPLDVPEDIQFAQIMRLMTSKHTSGLPERHALAVKKVCRLSSSGFLLQHLDPLIELFDLVVSRYESGLHMFGPVMIDMAKTASLPFVARKASDMVTYGHRLPQFLIVMMKLFAVAAPDPDLPAELQTVREQIRIDTGHMLACWARHGLDANAIDPSEPLSIFAQVGTPNLRAIDQSTAVDAVAGAFRVEDSEESIVVMLGAIRDMSLYTPLARKISNSGLLSHLVHVIHLHMMGSDVLLVAVEIMWNVLELDWEGASAALGSLDLLESFCEFMHMALVDGYREKDRALRNDLMVLLSIVARRPEVRRLYADSGLLAVLVRSALAPNALLDLDEAGRLDELLATATTAASGKNPVGTRPIALTNSPEDMEYRILVWSTLATCCTDARCAELSQQFGFVASLLSYLDPAPGEDTRHWSREQIRTLQVQSLDSLFHITKSMPESIREAPQGILCVLRLLETAMGFQQYDEGLQRKCLLLLLAAMAKPGYVDDIGEAGVRIVVNCFTDSSTMGIRQLCASVLSALCSGHKANQRAFRKNGGVELLVKNISYKPEDTLENFLSFEVCVIDAVWSCIVGNVKNEQRFIDQDGLFNLLEVLEVGPMMLKRQCLGCLADLVENPRAARMFVQWNSDITMKGGLKLLLELWEAEQLRRGATNDGGEIVDCDYPLNPPQPFQADTDKADGMTTQNALMSSRTMGRQKTSTSTDRFGAKGMLSDVFNFDEKVRETQDIRAKIYGILSKVGFEGHESLSIRERQHIELLKLYPECRVLETWLAVQDRIKKRGLKPLAVDAEYLEQQIAEQRTRTKWILNVQQQLQAELENEEAHHLNRFYDTIRMRARAEGEAEGHPPPRAENDGEL
jgi:hypothetical protein